VEFRILGPLEVRDGDALLTPAGAGLRALLTLLLLHVNEPVSTDRLLDALWPEGPPPSGAAALQVRVSQLRKALGAAGQLVVTRATGYSIEVGRGELDVDRFEELVGRADAAEPAEAALLLREALGLWRGPALADVAYAEFAQPAIARLEELQLAALERRIEADLELGRHADLVGELDALVKEHPLRERMRSQHMLALYRSGRQADALGSFQEARIFLDDELGIAPGPVLRQLQLAILRQDPSLDLAGTVSPDRAVLVFAPAGDGLDSLLALAEPLVRKPLRELIVAWLVGSESALAAANNTLRARQEELVARDVVARTACFTTSSAAADAVRLSAEQEVDLLLLAGNRSPLEDPGLRAVLAAAPCDVGILIERDQEQPPGPVLVPFGGGEHDWTAVELGAWLSGALGVPLRLAGPRETDRDASRLLASASLATQRAFGVTAEPLLVEPGPEGIVQAAEDAALVVVGLSDRWQRDGLGPVRSAIVEHARPPVLLARSGLRPGGLAPRESLTRFTWSIGP
jgi:DNA-binding SARP family transcriptional activator/nucleotide-binding universal stress UspA family protein